MRMNTQHAEFATKSDLLAVKADFFAVKAEVKAVEANLKGWMRAITLSLMTSVFAMIYPLYGLLRNPAVVKPAPAQQIVAPPATAPAPTIK